MKKSKKVLVIFLCAIAAIITLGYIPIWKNDREARENRKEVYSLIEQGEDLTKAEEKLRSAGFRLGYEEPITPTIDKDYLQQIVVIGNTKPNFFESIGYASGASWMPFVHSESPYVIIDATLEGEIIRIR